MSISTDVLVGDIQQMFANINEGGLNCWGIVDGKRFVPLACLKCTVNMYGMQEFAKFGPPRTACLTPLFCGEHACDYYKKLFLLRDTAKREGKDFKVLYERALEPLRNLERKFERCSGTRIARSTGKPWVYF